MLNHARSALRNLLRVLSVRSSTLAIMMVATIAVTGWSAFAYDGAHLYAADRTPTRLEGVPAAGLTVGEAGMRLRGALPWLLGMDAPRNYLVLIQNNHELRPTGGFIAAVGRVTVDKGRIQALDFSDSYTVYSDKSTYPLAPKPMQKYMHIPLLLLRDANWSPDLPTTAEVARVLYAQDANARVDGVFTVDLNAVKYLIGALGALDVPGASELITRDNIEAQVIQFWEKPLSGATIDNSGIDEWFAQRKDFIPQIAKAALDRVQKGNVNYPALLNAVQAALDDRSIQGWVNNSKVQDVLAEAHWNGGLQPEPGADFLAVVDTNMGYNKVDAAVERSLGYAVSWPDGADQPALATLTLTYTHPIQAEDPGCDPTPRYGTTYKAMISRCYFDYVRIYVPAGSELVKVEGIAPENVTSQRGERGTHEFAGYFTVSPASEHRLVFSYRLPASITPDTYRLVVQRQAGTQPLSVQLDIAGSTYDGMLSNGWLELPIPGA